MISHIRRFLATVFIPITYLPLLRLRFRFLMDPVHIPEMDAQSIEGYTDKMYYAPGQKITFFIRSIFKSNKLEVKRITAPHDYESLAHLEFGPSEQEIQSDSPGNGCNWSETLSYTLENTAEQGYYRVKIGSDIQENFITFLCGRKTNHKIAVIAPVSTWTAYNPYGGKSLYKNFQDEKNVHFVSTQRPNTAIQYKQEQGIHDINVEANIFNWFNRNFGADLFPDYYLENGPEFFKNYKIIVFAYHNEYISPKMYECVMRLQNMKGISMLFMGANQFYWKVRWNKDYTRMECRKDGTFFSSPFGFGGLWSKNAKRAEDLMGSRFTDAGTSTYAPYLAANPDHFLFFGLNLKKDTLFGQRGINRLPICGDETDKRSIITSGDWELLAKGLNPSEYGTFRVFNDKKSDWNGDGGGEILYKSAVGKGYLSTGSIQSGSGLGHDDVFTTLIHNFTKKYHG